MKMPAAVFRRRDFVAVVAFVGISIFSAQPALAKMGSTAIQLYMIAHPVDAVVLARFDAGSKDHLVVEKSYAGKLREGDKMALAGEDRGEFDIPALDPARNASQKFLLFLVQKKLERSAGYDFRINDEWMSDFSACRRVVDGRVYDWRLGKPYRLPESPKPKEDAKDELIPDESTGTLAKAESLVSYGLSLHEHWAEAKASTDNMRKLALLRSFLIPTDDGMFTPYMVWAVTSETLDEMAKTGAAGVPFLEEILKLPAYQDSFAPGGWIGFGAQQRLNIMHRLCLQKAALKTDPAQKLAELAPVFILVNFECSAGCDGECLLSLVMDKALAEAGTAGAAAIPFLQELLTRPYFQKSYSYSQINMGQQRREKIEAALARLQAR